MGKYNSDQRGEDPGDESFSLRMVESVFVNVCVTGYTKETSMPLNNGVTFWSTFFFGVCNLLPSTQWGVGSGG